MNEKPLGSSEFPRHPNEPETMQEIEARAKRLFLVSTERDARECPECGGTKPNPRHFRNGYDVGGDVMTRPCANSFHSYQSDARREAESFLNLNFEEPFDVLAGRLAALLDWYRAQGGKR